VKRGGLLVVEPEGLAELGELGQLDAALALAALEKRANLLISVRVRLHLGKALPVPRRFRTERLFASSV
jgi:hypothetical protein